MSVSFGASGEPGPCKQSPQSWPEAKLSSLMRSMLLLPKVGVCTAGSHPCPIPWQYFSKASAGSHLSCCDSLPHTVALPPGKSLNTHTAATLTTKLSAGSSHRHGCSKQAIQERLCTSRGSLPGQHLLRAQVPPSPGTGQQNAHLPHHPSNQGNTSAPRQLRHSVSATGPGSWLLHYEAAGF